MRIFAVVTCLALISAKAQLSLAADWADASIKVDTKTMACYTDKFLYGLIKKAGDTYGSCITKRGNYPTGGQMGVSFCLFDKLGYLKSQGMKIDWAKVTKDYGVYSKFVTDCKDTDYDTDGGFWDNVSDWWNGENFKYPTVDKAIGNFYSCVAAKLAKEAEAKFRSKYFAVCPAV